MSCALTIDAVRNQTKTVTRRHVDTWRALAPGDRLTLIEKGMGLPKGATQTVLAEVEIVSVRVEPLQLMSSDVRYGRQEVALEGFPGHDPHEWVAWWAKSHGEILDGSRLPLCRRIEWRYLSEATLSDGGAP